MARSPESVVASPYVGRKNGSIVMMKMPKPKPVVRCTKLAPMLNRKMAMTRLLIVIQSRKKYRKLRRFWIFCDIYGSKITHYFQSSKHFRVNYANLKVLLTL